MTSPSTIGVLFSGGLDSAVLTAMLAHACEKIVQPIMIRSGAIWEEAEFAAASAFLASCQQSHLQPLVTLDLPVEDVYGSHWSMTGINTPDYASADNTVFLPGRNLLLLSKAAVWCQLNGVGELALGTLQGNPFEDADRDFLNAFEMMLWHSELPPVKIVQPLANLTKAEVMRAGQQYSLVQTFSCLAPIQNLGNQWQHCGACNKCRERHEAFKTLGDDPTEYHEAAEPSLNYCAE